MVMKKLSTWLTILLLCRTFLIRSTMKVAVSKAALTDCSFVSCQTFHAPSNQMIGWSNAFNRKDKMKSSSRRSLLSPWWLVYWRVKASLRVNESIKHYSPVTYRMHIWQLGHSKMNKWNATGRFAYMLLQIQQRNDQRKKYLLYLSCKDNICVQLFRLPINRIKFCRYLIDLNCHSKHHWRRTKIDIPCYPVRWMSLSSLLCIFHVIFHKRTRRAWLCVVLSSVNFNQMDIFHIDIKLVMNVYMYVCVSWWWRRRRRRW